MKIKIPPFIKEKDSIGITAPSFGCTTEPYISKYNTAKELLEEKEYTLKCGETVSQSDGLGISTDPRICARELEEFYADPSVRAIISAGGGEMMCETAGYIDFDRISKADPKWFMGYSDNTNFIFPLVTICHTAAIYGPCISGFGKKWEQSEIDAFRILEGKTKHIQGYPMFQRPEDDVSPDKDLKNYTYSLKSKKVLSSYIPKGGKLYRNDSEEKIEMQGILLGGCLDVLANLCGTKLDRVKEFKDYIGNDKIIWVLESCDANPMELRRQVWHLRNAGWFDGAAGFLVGRPLSAFEQEMMGVNQYNAVTDILTDLGVPVIMDCDIGHVDPAMPLVMGSKAKIYAKGNEIDIIFDI